MAQWWGTVVAIVTLTQVIERPAQDVFDAIIDVARFPAWNPTTKRARRLSDGPTGEGTRFEFEVRGFGRFAIELREFDRNRQVRLVPQIKSFMGGHRFILTAEGAHTRVDHELEMTPRGLFKTFAPMLGMMGRKNLRDTANALKAYVEAKRTLSDPLA